MVCVSPYLSRSRGCLPLPPRLSAFRFLVILFGPNSPPLSVSVSWPVGPPSVPPPSDRTSGSDDSGWLSARRQTGGSPPLRLATASSLLFGHNV